VTKLKSWIIHHQVGVFLLLTFAITWPGFFIVYFFFPGNQVVEAFMSPVVFSPAIAAMWIAVISDQEPERAPDKRRWITFLIIWLIAALVLMLNSWKVYDVEFAEAGTTIVFSIFSAIFALPPAWVISSAYARSPGLRKQFSTILSPRGPAIWYLVIFLVFPGVLLLDYFILSPLFGLEMKFFLSDLGIGGAAVYLAVDFLRGFLMTGGINEESGWRGFALPRLQSRYPVIISALIVWFFWAAWHLPYDFGRGVPVAWILQNRLLWNLVFSILFTWLYNRTNGSILAPALFHPAMNTFGNHFSKGTISGFIFILIAIFAIFLDRMWKKLPANHPAAYQIHKGSDGRRS
jgi:membrane protease YdiL (CAAX protease family)